MTDFDDGTEPMVEDFRIYNGGSEDTSNVFPVITVDRAGNLYAAWSQTQSTPGTSQTIYMATSTDRGKPGRRASASALSRAPTSCRGSSRAIPVVRQSSGIEARSQEIQTALASEWMIHMAQTLNAFDAAPTFQTVPVSQNIVHRGEICTDGTLCDARGATEASSNIPPLIWTREVRRSSLQRQHQPVRRPIRNDGQAGDGAKLAGLGRILGKRPGTVSVTTPAANSTIRTEHCHHRGHTHGSTKELRPGRNRRRAFPLDRGEYAGSRPALGIAAGGGRFAVLTMQVADLTPAARSSCGSFGRKRRWHALFDAVGLCRHGLLARRRSPHDRHKLLHGNTRHDPLGHVEEIHYLQPGPG